MVDYFLGGNMLRYKAKCRVNVFLLRYIAYIKNISNQYAFYKIISTECTDILH